MSGNFNPLVSIVIPVFNGSNYLANAIDSALAQTYENVEVIVINDGSTDNGSTEAISRVYGDRIRYLWKKNGGVSSALNLGLKQMKGEYFSWLSHDDTYYPNKVEREVEYIRDNTGTDIVASGLNVINDSGQKVSEYKTASVVNVQTGRDLMDHWIYGCSLLMRKELLEEMGGFNELNYTTQDLEMWLKIVFSGKKITLIPDILCQWRHHQEMGSYSSRPKYLREIEQLFCDLLKTYPLDFFSASESKSLSRRDRALTYDWLGEQAKSRGAVGMAREFYSKAALAYPNPFDKIFRLTVHKTISGYLRGNRMKMISETQRN